MACPDETALLRFVGGRAGGDANAIDEHIVACGTCRRLVIEIARTSLGRGEKLSDAPTLADPVGQSARAARVVRGEQIGRYVVLGRLGAGGMGVVVGAYDPELDRAVALKLLHPELGEARERLLHEARAIAKLSHPNVVAIHDVSTHADRMFISMELVDAGNLAEWLAAAPRSVPEIVGMFVQAGRGLAAAHEAGLVHRDFKPANVLVGKDGRARVSDFGLAHDEKGGAAATGVLAGTPAYMAPEQLAGEGFDARTDQFGFAVALYEALYGVRPYAGSSIEELAASTARGALVAPVRDVSVPARMRRALERALASKRDERFPSMEALLAELGERRPRRWWIAAAALAATSVAITAVLLARPEAPPACADESGQLRGAWDADRRTAMQRAFAATKLPFAGDAFTGAANALDAWSARWSAARTDACVATRVRRDQSEALLDLQIACLDQRKKELAALVDLLAAGDPAVVSHAVQAAHSLSPVDSCADRAALTAVAPPPPAIAAPVQAARVALAEVQALIDGGRYPDAVAKAKQIVEQARSLAYRPLQAEAQFKLGSALEKQNDIPGAEDVLQRAALAAEAARDDYLTARALISLIDVVGYRAGRHDQATPLIERAAAAIERTGGDDELSGMLDYYRGGIEIDTAHPQEAVASYQRALAKFEKRGGPDHPYVAASLDALGAAQLALGKLDDALASEQRALEITERTVGRSHPDVAFSLDKIGAILMNENKLAEARPYIERSVALRSSAPDDPYYGASLTNLADLERAAGNLDQALALHRRALPILERTLGADHVYVAMSLQAQAWLLIRLGRPAEALPLAERTMRILDKHQDSPLVPLALTRIGEAHLGLHHPVLALAPLERAVALAGSLADAEPNVRAEPKFALARALHAAGRDATRARTLAGEARAIYAAAGTLAQNDVREIDVWLAKK